MVSFLITLSSLTLLFMFLLSTFRFFRSKNLLPLPPGPPGLPIIGNLHQLDTSDLSDHLWRLSKRYGPLMSLRLGLVQALVVSSAEMAEEVLKTKDLIFCTRPGLTGMQKVSYDNKDVVFSAYSEYWREMRKLCNLHLFSMKQVNSFRWVREAELFDMIDTIKNRISLKESVNLSETMMNLTSNIICRVAFGKRPSAYDEEQKQGRRIYDLVLECQALIEKFYYRDYFPFMGWLDKLNGTMARLETNFKAMDDFFQELIDDHLNQNTSNKTGQEDLVDILLKLKQDSDSPFHLTFDHIKAMIMNVLLGGTDTSATAVVWAMTLLMKNPQSLKKVQQEVRKAVGSKGRVEENDLDKLEYLKAVIKETLRLFPVAPLLIPRESREACVLDRYQIPKKSVVYVNAWAVGRDPKSWERPEEFEPERFMGSNIDYKGMDFEFIPFGSGRRICPGMTMGVVTTEIILSNLLYSFDWEFPEGIKDIDTLKAPGTVIHRKNALRLVARVHHHDCKI